MRALFMGNVPGFLSFSFCGDCVGKGISAGDVKGARAKQ